MTVVELMDLAQRLTYKGRRCMKVLERNPRDGYRLCPEGYVYVSTSIQVIGVEDNLPGIIESGGLCSIKDLAETNEASEISQVKYTLTLLEMHEIEETMALDGKAIFDPHNMGYLRLKEELKEAA